MHRDVKSLNILLRREYGDFPGEDGGIGCDSTRRRGRITVKLCDFGCVREWGETNKKKRKKSLNSHTNDNHSSSPLVGVNGSTYRNNGSMQIPCESSSIHGSIYSSEGASTGAYDVPVGVDTAAAVAMARLQAIGRHERPCDEVPLTESAELLSAERRLMDSHMMTHLVVGTPVLTQKTHDHFRCNVLILHASLSAICRRSTRTTASLAHPWTFMHLELLFGGLLPAANLGMD